MLLPLIHRSRLVVIKKTTEVMIARSKKAQCLSNGFPFDWYLYRKHSTFGVNPIYLMIYNEIVCTGKKTRLQLISSKKTTPNPVGWKTFSGISQKTYRITIFSTVSIWLFVCCHSARDIIDAIFCRQLRAFQLLCAVDRLGNARRFINISSLWLRNVVCRVNHGRNANVRDGSERQTTTETMLLPLVY